MREYVGSGPLAERAAERDASEREDRLAKTEDWRLERRRLEESDGIMEALADACEVAVSASLLAAGFHKHKSEWRKKRG